MKQQTKLFTQSFHHLLTFSMIKKAVKNKNKKAFLKFDIFTIHSFKSVGPNLTAIKSSFNTLLVFL